MERALTQHLRRIPFLFQAFFDLSDVFWATSLQDQDHL